MSNICQLDSSIFHESFFLYQSKLSERELDIGIFENYEIPSWLSPKLAEEITVEIEDNIMNLWTRNANQFS